MPAAALHIPATDGFPLAATVHAPEGPPRAVVVVSPATAVRRSFYERFCAFLARRGFVAVTFDLRGVGDSRPASLRGFAATMDDWARKDIAGVLAWAEKEHPRLPRAFVGHSVSGQVVGLVDGAERLACVVSVASQHGDWRRWPAPTRWLRALQWYVGSPLLVPLLGRLPRWVLGQELPKGVALQWARWCRSRDFLFVDAPPGARERFAALTMPWLAYSFGDDEYGPHAVHDALMALYPRVRLERRRVEPADVGARAVGHFGFYRPQLEATLWDEAAAWIGKHAG